MIRVAIVAQGQAMRAGLRALLGAGVGLEVIAEAATTAELGQLQQRADLLLVTADAAGKGDLERLVRGLAPGPGLLLVGDDGAAALAVVGLPLRSWGIVPLEVSAEELSAAAHAVHQGLLVGAPALLEPLLSRALSAADVEPLAEQLTAREAEVLQFVAQGLANKQIALALGISEHTVKFHISSCYAKLGATNRTDAVRIATRRGLITL